MLHCPPLRERVFRGKTSATAHSCPLTVPSRADRDLYKQWPDWSMEKAVEAVNIHKLSIRRAAQQYNIYPNLLLQTESVGAFKLVLLAALQSTSLAWKRRSWLHFYVAVELWGMHDQRPRLLL